MTGKKRTLQKLAIIDGIMEFGEVAVPANRVEGIVIDDLTRHYERRGDVLSFRREGHRFIFYVK